MIPTVKVDKEKVLRVLKVGKEKIEAGWCQGANFIDEHGYEANEIDDVKLGKIRKVCMVGGVAYAIAFLGLEDSYYKAAANLLCEELDKSSIAYYDLNLWNDTPNRKASEVVGLFDRVVTTLEKK